MSAEPEFAEMIAATNYSFLRGASHPSDMVAQAIALGHKAIGIADRNTVAGVVRAYVALRDKREDAVAMGLGEIDLRLIVGARLAFVDGTPDIVAYPVDRAGWGRLTRLLTLGNRRAAKGECVLNLADLIEHAQGLLLIAVADETHEFLLRRLARVAPLWIAATMPRQGDDARRLTRLQRLSKSTGIPLLATCDALYAGPEQRPLHDIVTCIREGATIAEAGHRLLANAERHLKSPREMARLFKQAPQAVTAWADIVGRIDFTLDDLKYEYPHEPVPQGWDPQDWLEHETLRLAEERYPDGILDSVRATLDTEFAIIRERGYAYYFLTVYEAVKYARSLDPPILCQGRGSAANSAVCYCLGITSVDPAQHKLLFSRFVSSDRKEPPDIDVDFEHERREEVIQEIYRRYGRERAGIAATVVHFRPRGAVREIGKALGMSEDLTTRLTSTVWGSFADRMETRRFADSGLDPTSVDIERLKWLVDQLLHAPRHLGQHVGGFVLSEGRLDEIVPIHNAAMPDRTFIEWDKDDIDALGLMKVDILALGMLTCIRKAFKLMRDQGLGDLTLATVPKEQPEVYAMLCEGDSIGVLPGRKPRADQHAAAPPAVKFYDLAVQVAIVRPGPIEGDMVHPYLRRREEFRLTGKEPDYPKPGPAYDQEELRGVLGQTLGVPLFQEQAMNLAITAAGFSGGEATSSAAPWRPSATSARSASSRRRWSAAWSHAAMRRSSPSAATRRSRASAATASRRATPSPSRCWVYVSSWIKCFHPAVFAAALLNSQTDGLLRAGADRQRRAGSWRRDPADRRQSQRLGQCGRAGIDDGKVHDRWTWGVATHRMDKGFGLRLGLRQNRRFPGKLGSCHRRRTKCPRAVRRHRGYRKACRSPRPRATPACGRRRLPLDRQGQARCRLGRTPHARRRRAPPLRRRQCTRACRRADAAPARDAARRAGHCRLSDDAAVAQSHPLLFCASRCAASASSAAPNSTSPRTARVRKLPASCWSASGRARAMRSSRRSRTRPASSTSCCGRGNSSAIAAR